MANAPSVVALFLALAVSACLQTPASSGDNRSGNGPSSANALVKPSSTCLNLVNGTATSAFPNVWLIGYKTADQSQIASECTGTFVSDNTMLTASHCLPCDTTVPILLLSNQGQMNPAQSAAFYSNLLNNSPTSKSYTSGETTLCGGNAPPATPGDPTIYTANDLAVVVFPDEQSTGFTPINNVNQPAKTPVTLVGYGMTDQSITQSTDPTMYKRTGLNSLIEPPTQVVLSPGIYQIVGPAHAGGANGTNTMPAHGDSGGPMLDNQGNIIGVTSGGEDDDDSNGFISQNYGATGLGNYIDLSGAAAAKLFNSATAIGARFNFAAGTDLGSNATTPATVSASTITAPANIASQPSPPSPAAPLAMPVVAGNNQAGNCTN